MRISAINSPAVVFENLFAEAHWRKIPHSPARIGETSGLTSKMQFIV